MFLPLLVQLSEAEDPRRIFAASPTEAYYMEPAELAAKAFVKRIVWSADGSTLFAERLVPPENTPPLAIANARQTPALEGLMKWRPRVQIIAWGRQSRTARTVLDLDTTRVRIEGMEPLQGSDRALLTLSEMGTDAEGKPAASIAYVLVSPSGGATARIWSDNNAAAVPARVMLSPKRPMGAIIVGPYQGPQSVAFFSADGKVGAPIKLSPNQRFDFSATGMPGVGTVATGAEGKKSRVFRLINPMTGAAGAIAVQDGFDEPAPPPIKATEFRTREQSVGILLRVNRGRTKEAVPEGDGIVTHEGTLPALSPKFDAVAYLSGNSAFVRPLVKVSRIEYEASMAEAAKQKAMSQAKQMGLAMAMYAADADDAFPPSTGDGKEVVFPYLKNRLPLDAFTYSFGGGAITGNPGETELGYVSGPGGRAVVYADGTVKWLPDGV